jgi:uncharacterized protein YndB with AHSA1/START domain
MNQTKIKAEPGRQEIFIEREFDAPRELLFRAIMDPKLISQWWGPRHYTTVVDKMEPRSGGQWRFINRDSEGHEFAFHGVYHEVVAPERVIDTFEFEGIPEKGHASLETMKLEELPGGRTKMTVQSVFQSVMDRDAMVASGMEDGVMDTYNRLEEALAKMK